MARWVDGGAGRSGAIFLLRGLDVLALQAMSGLRAILFTSASSFAHGTVFGRSSHVKIAYVGHASE